MCQIRVRDIKIGSSTYLTACLLVMMLDMGLSALPLKEFLGTLNQDVDDSLITN